MGTINTSNLKTGWRVVIYINKPAIFYELIVSNLQPLSPKVVFCFKGYFVLEVRIYKGKTGRLYGIADWEDIRLYFSNFRKNDDGCIYPLPFQKNNDGIYADVSIPPTSHEYYINARGQKRWKNRICGLLWYNNDIAYLALELGSDQKQKFFCTPIYKTSEVDNKKYLSLNFKIEMI